MRIIMIAINYQTDYEIQKLAFSVLQKKLGITNLIRFMKQYDKGYGNYTTDRDAWQKEYTVDKLFEQIKKLF